MAHPKKKKEREKIAKAKSAGSASPASVVPRQDATSDLQRILNEALRPLLEQVMEINRKLDAQQAQVNGNTKKIDQHEQELKEVDTNAKKLQKQMQALAKKRQEVSQLLQLQMERASYVLRFQGIPEEKVENLMQIMSKALGQMAEMKAENQQTDIDAVFRSYTEFIRENDLLGEVMVRFSRRRVRDQILKAANGVTLKIKGKEIKVLKDIPFEVRRKRHQYKDLILFLQKKQIAYRWILPEGVIFKFINGKEKIDSVEKAREFLHLHSCPADGEEGEEGDSSKEGGGDGAEPLSGEESNFKLGAVAPKVGYKLRRKKDKK